MNIEKEKNAIKYLKLFEPKKEPYYLCYSGGKDSDTILALAKLAGVNYEAVHNLTTADAPETIYHVRKQPGVRINPPEKTMWQLIVENKMPPTRLIRYCCRELKERGGRFRKKITGVRWAESTNRKNNQGLITVIGKDKTMRRLAEEAGIDYEESAKGGLILNHDNAESRAFVDHCYRTTSVMVNPIVDWTDDDVWEFLYHYRVEVNPLYEVKAVGCAYCPCGDNRIGCIVCPMQGYKGMIADLIKFPKYRDNYLRAFDRMLQARKAARLEISDKWRDARSVMMWWVGDDPRQLSLFGEPDYLKGACL